MDSSIVDVHHHSSCHGQGSPRYFRHLLCYHPWRSGGVTSVLWLSVNEKKRSSSLIEIDQFIDLLLQLPIATLAIEASSVEPMETENDLKTGLSGFGFPVWFPRAMTTRMSHWCSINAIDPQLAPIYRRWSAYPVRLSGDSSASRSTDCRLRILSVLTNADEGFLWFTRERPLPIETNVESTWMHIREGQPISGRREFGEETKAAEIVESPPALVLEEIAENDWTEVRRIHAPQTSLWNYLECIIDLVFSQSYINEDRCTDGGTRETDTFLLEESSFLLERFTGHFGIFQKTDRCIDLKQPMFISSDFSLSGT